MTANFINQLKYAALASRLSNFQNHFAKDADLIYKDFDLDFEPRWFTMIKLLSNVGPMTVTEVASMLNQTHPAINQVGVVLEKKGLIRSKKDKFDSRKRILELTRKGEKLTETLEPFWKAIENAAIDLMINNAPDFIENIERVENAISEKSMFTRTIEQLMKMPGNFDIVDYSDEYQQYFEQLNLHWLKAEFKVEENDKKMLRQPKENIIDRKGRIIFARLMGKIVGTCALLSWSSETIELTKMAIDERYRSLGIGQKLLDEMIDYAQKQNFQKMVLLTSPTLNNAVSLYTSRGFAECNMPDKLANHYERCSIYMELPL